MSFSVSPVLFKRANIAKIRLNYILGFWKVTLDISEILYVESLIRKSGYMQPVTGDSETRQVSPNGRIFSGEDFVRVHRSYVVRKNVIASVAGESLILQNGMEIPVSRKYRDIVSSIR